MKMGFASKHSLLLATLLHVSLLLPNLVLGQGHRDYSQKNSPYSDTCGTDPEEIRYFPASAGRRRLWYSKAFASQQVLSMTQNGKPGEFSRYLLEGATEDEDGDAIPLYRCPCGSIEQEDEFNQTVQIHSYCPLDFTCVFYIAENETAQCIAAPFINHFANMAWPFFVVTLACFVGVLLLSMHGISFVKYLRKHCVCYGFYRAKTQEELQEEESREVDELMAISRLDPPPPKPSRLRIFHFQLWQYQTQILRGAREGWGIEWNIYRREQAQEQQNRLQPRVSTQMELYLKTKIYGMDGNTALDKSTSNTSRTSDDEDELRTIPTTTSSSSDGSKGIPTDAAINATLVAEPSISCSICFAEIEAGQRVGNLACGHTFHSGCLKTWIQTGIRNTCPLCQAPGIARPAPGREDQPAEEGAVNTIV